MFDSLLEHVDYPALRHETERRRAAGEHVGLAATMFVEMGNPGVFEQARVVAEEDGTFTAYVGIASVGQGVETVLSQIAADVLGVAIERVRVFYQDTAVVPEGQGAFSSRATVWGGYAISGAVHELLSQARAGAARRLRAEAGEIEFADGAAEWGGESIPICELVREARFRYEPGGGSHVLSGANVGQVRVDPVSGAVELLRYAVAYEVGRAINPLTLEGQVRGAAVQGMGGALLEDFAYTSEGQPLASTFMDYMLPTAAEVPDIDVLLLEYGETSEEDPIAGAKGAGEGGIIATAATITSAVADAIGPAAWSLSSIPLRPEAVQRLAMGEGAARVRAGPARRPGR